MMLYQKENENTKKVILFFQNIGKFLIDVLAEELARLDSRSKQMEEYLEKN
jgi:hypothetical protein